MRSRLFVLLLGLAALVAAAPERTQLAFQVPACAGTSSRTCPWEQTIVPAGTGNALGETPRANVPNEKHTEVEIDIIEEVPLPEEADSVQVNPWKSLGDLTQLQLRNPLLNVCYVSDQKHMNSKVKESESERLNLSTSVNVTVDSKELKPKPRVTVSNRHFDYASEAAGAKVINASENVAGAANVLISNPDKYLMVPCKQAYKWIVIQLSEDIKITEFGIRNLEHYSSGFQNIQVLGSERYPTPHWILLGNFVVGSSREEYRFEVIDQAWIRYLKVRFLSHHSERFFCTVTSIHAYGIRVIEDLEEGIKKLENPELYKEKDKDTPKVPSHAKDASSHVETNNLEASAESTPAAQPSSVFERLTMRIAALDAAQKELKSNISNQLDSTLRNCEKRVSDALHPIQLQFDHYEDRLNLVLEALNASEYKLRICLDGNSEVKSNIESLTYQVRSLEIVAILLCLGFAVILVGLFCAICNFSQIASFRDSDLMIDTDHIASNLRLELQQIPEALDEKLTEDEKEFGVQSAKLPKPKKRKQKLRHTFSDGYLKFPPK